MRTKSKNSIVLIDNLSKKSSAFFNLREFYLIWCVKIILHWLNIFFHSLMDHKSIENRTSDKKCWWGYEERRTCIPCWWPDGSISAHIPKGLNVLPQRYMFIAALITIARKWKQPRCPLTNFRSFITPMKTPCLWAVHSTFQPLCLAQSNHKYTFYVYMFPSLGCFIKIGLYKIWSFVIVIKNETNYFQALSTK